MPNKIKNGWAHFIVSRQRHIVIIFIVLSIISAISACFVVVNYDLTEYLPKTSKTSMALDIMEKEFGYPGTARLVIKDVNIYEAKIYKDEISVVDGVDMVLWLDLENDIYQSELMLDESQIEAYFKDDCASMYIIFSSGDYDKQTSAAINEIKQIVGEKGLMSGSAVQSNELSKNLMREMAVSLVIGIILALIILTVTTTSWIEPFIFIGIMGVAIIINMGTNIFAGRISFLTFSLVSILQLAIAMDYSIFLLHSFTRERQKGFEPEQAMENALNNSVVSIISSGATTVVGFLALLLMKFKIGSDMGIALAKGIIISVVTVLVLMPSVILKLNKLIEKTTHKSFMPSFKTLGRIVYRLRIVVLVLVLILIIPANVAQGMNRFNYGSSALGAGKGTQAYEDDKQINEIFGESNLMLVLVPSGENDSNLKEKELANELKGLEYVSRVVSLADLLPDGIPESFLPSEVTSILHTENYARMIIFVDCAIEGDEAFAYSDEIESVVNSHYDDGAYLLSLTTATKDIKETIVKDYSLINIVSILAVLFVIVICYRKIVMPVLLIIPIIVAIKFNMSVPYIAGEELMYIGYIIISCLQLGATVDYSILLSGNYKNARLTMNKREAVIHAVSKSALSVITSSSILAIVGYAMYFVCNTTAIASMGHLTARGALISAFLVLFLTPALLSIFDRAVVRNNILWRKRK